MEFGASDKNEDNFAKIELLQEVLENMMECRTTPIMLQNYATLGAYVLLLKDSLILYKVLEEGMQHVLKNFFKMNEENAKKAIKLLETHVHQMQFLDEIYDDVRSQSRLFKASPIKISLSSIPTLKTAETEKMLHTMQEYLQQNPIPNHTTHKLTDIIPEDELHEMFKEGDFVNEEEDDEEEDDEEEEEEEEKEDVKSVVDEKKDKEEEENGVVDDDWASELMGGEPVKKEEEKKIVTATDDDILGLFSQKREEKTKSVPANIHDPFNTNVNQQQYPPQRQPQYYPPQRPTYNPYQQPYGQQQQRPNPFSSGPTAPAYPPRTYQQNYNPAMNNNNNPFATNNKPKKQQKPTALDFLDPLATTTTTPEKRKKTLNERQQE
eukprot:CAMPEP_0117427738 /NCGR_PEP_ID=MMETSP0758-20121206/7543_1 /TAXON_ID=63605 /ORGANISM="Percolomonas cosmopolitus, Strain AE-1 (ATCC 50343)" /LENGTH=378 /DNA_ID=CAMNT_0005213589 /DNA_START=446 /DNA_END=1579 /DNA_ORIENTATION=+